MYSYSELNQDLEFLSRRFKVFSIGESGLGREILAVQFGGKPKVLLFGAIHAREWITAPLLVSLAVDFGERLFEKNIEAADGKNILMTDIAFVPMVNPDGVELCARGVKSLPQKLRKEVLSINGKSDFSLWKANAFGVDLNVNFDALWGTGKENVFCPSSESFVGKYPFSEIETRVIADYSKNSKLAIAYHTKGEEIYYGFDGDETHKNIADIFGKELNYKVSTSFGSAGGFKDWFVQQKLGIGLTFECCSDDLAHPIGLEQLESLKEKHKNIAQLAIKIANSLECERV